MNLPETITFHGGPAAVIEAQDLDSLEFMLDGARCADHGVPAQTQEYDLVVNVVGLPDAASVSGWVLLLG